MATENLTEGLNTIDFGPLGGGDKLGGYRQVGQDLWREDGVVSGGDIFEFRETARDANSVHLHDTRRNVHVQLDLLRNVARCTEPGAAPRDLYAILGHFAAPTGWLTNHVDCGAPGALTGGYKQVGNREWIETDVAGKAGFHFVERSRDDWSVYLHDTTRAVDIQLDLWRRKVHYRDGAGSAFDLFDIAAASTRVTGWTVRRVSHGTRTGAVNGRFKETGERVWTEEGADGSHVFHYAETGRDDWSVYLFDAVRGVAIQLDLWRRKVRDAETGKPMADLYDIVDDSAAVSGWTVNRVDAGASESQTLTTYRQVGATYWEEAAPGQAAGFSFHEAGRDDGSVHLHDPSRNVDLQLDLRRRKIRYGSGGGKLSDLYDVAATGSGVNGFTAIRVDFGTWPDAITGSFAQTGDRDWAQMTPDGTIQFRFDEVARDDGSVYLHDATRDVRIQLDLLRRKVRYRASGGAESDLYDVAGQSAKMNGWLVNHVTYNAARSDPRRPGSAGAFRQVGLHHWVEDTAYRGPETFSFRETGRDAWSVYLADDSRNVTIQIDLLQNVILYGDARTRLRPWYAIAAADRIPHMGLASAAKVNWVDFGDAAGTLAGSFRQTSQTTWSEDSADGRRDLFRFTESRDRWSIHLRDDSRAVRIRIDLFRDRIYYSDADTAEYEIYRVVEPKSKLTGWLVNTVGCESGGKHASSFRQSGWTSWVEHSIAQGNVTNLFDEVGRDDWSVHLHDPSRDVRVQLDLATRQVKYAAVGAPATTLYNIVTSTRKDEPWLKARRMTSRSQLTESFEVANGKRTSVAVYRNSLSLSPLATHIDVTASEQVDVEIDGKSYTLDAQKPVRIRAAVIGKMSVAMKADALQCPAIYVRTNLMKPGERHVLMADVETHNKLATLKDGDLYAARGQIGLGSLTAEDAGHLQAALTNLARTAQHSYNETPHGFQHDRALLPTNMKHPHFKLDFAGGKPRYSAMTRDQVIAHVRGAERLSPSAAQGFFSDIGDFFKKAASVVVHTVEKVGEDIVDTARHVAHDVVETVDHVGEDLIHGDLLEAGKDLIQGGEHLGTDLVKGATSVGGDLVKGATQMIVVTMDFGGKLKQFVIDHTGLVGKAIGWLLEKAGAEVGKAVRWVMAPLGWDDVLLVHDVLRDAVNARLDWMQGYPQQIKAVADDFFQRLGKTMSSDVEGLIHKLDASRYGGQPQPPRSHSGAVEKVEWLLSKLFEYGHDPDPIGSSFVAATTGGPLAPLQTMIQDELGADGSKVREAFGDSLAQLQEVFTDSSKGPEHLLAAVLEFGKGVALLGIDVATRIIDMVLDLISATVSGLKDLINAPIRIPILADFYSGLTDGRPMTVLSIVSLLIATPATIIHKAAAGTRPFASGPALDLVAQGDHIKSIGNTYGSMHIIMSVLGPIAAGMAAFNWAVDAIGKDMAGALGSGAGADATASFGPGTTTVRAMAVTAGIVAQIMANPVPAGQPYSMPLDGAKDDVLEAPNYWSHVIWHCQTGWLFFSVVGAIGVTAAEATHVKVSKLDIGGNILGFAMGAWGVAHIVLMGVLDQADRAKRDVVHDVLSPTTNHDKTDAELITLFDERAKERAKEINGAHVVYARPKDAQGIKDYVDALRNYHVWSQDVNPFKPLPNKGFGNVMDGLPEVGQICSTPYAVEASKGYSLIGMAAAELLGHLGEGITMLARTANDELL